MLYLIEIVKKVIIAIIVTPSNYLRILIVVIIKTMRSLLSALDILSLSSIRSELINRLIIKYYTKKRPSSDLRI